VAAHRKRGPTSQLHPQEVQRSSPGASLCGLHQRTLRAVSGHVSGAQTAQNARTRRPAGAHTRAA